MHSSQETVKVKEPLEPHERTNLARGQPRHRELLQQTRETVDKARRHFKSQGRIWCRIFVVRAWGWDDFFLVLVMISISVGTIGACIATDHGLGKHLLYLSPKQISNYMMIFYICNGTLPTSTSFIKVAILLQYLRTFERGTKSRALTIAVLVITGLWGAVYTFLAWVPCVPVAAYWDWTITTKARWGFASGNLEDLVWLYGVHATSNMLLDFIIFAIPLPLYLNDEASKKSRKSVLGLFTLGTFVLMLAIWRLVELMRSRVGTYPTLDVTWYTPLPMTLAILEIDIAAICASLPVFWPVLQSSMGAIFVTREVKITTETVDTHADDDDCLEMAGPFSLCHQSSATMLNDTAGLIDPGDHATSPSAQTSPESSPRKETVIFGAYMQGKTTCDVEALRAG
ncbi:hypothetical protein LX32DRAFT_660721 [Colletotrichum zoysiae]|uniref:Rhodopsin domain-containing protein n=1 Tax=Colletotrichum zoysiae TaxID=1216348 RepID=A0AAD9M895_9PEZI|nr:hypothetical protein LX32DRAFT_660721 [Colletotrichum zoysiae]